MTHLRLDGDQGPAEHMRRDAELLAAAERDPDWVATLRLFRFRPYGITLGRAQRPEHALDLAACARDGVDWAVRPTGGRAIFHADEWTYSFTARLDDPEWGGGLARTYAAISSLIAGSLRRLGVPAELAPGRRGAIGPSGGAPCFVSTARHEIVRDGRKLAGSAQRRTATALLQQGSVLLGPGHARLADYAPGPADARRAMRAELLAATAHAGDVLGPEAPLERWAEALEDELAGVRRRDDAPDVQRLTVSETRSYTAGSLAAPAPYRSPGDAR